VTSTFAGLDLCVRREGCAASTSATDPDPGTVPCGRPGFACQELPTRPSPGARAGWAPACWPGWVAPIGGSCTADRDCVGGRCERRTIDGTDVSYCTMRCGADASCPSYAACVHDQRDPDSNAFLCMAKTEFCPRLESLSRSLIDSLRYEPYDASDGARTNNVCYFAE
jgi:hypothetical protein